MDILDTTGTRRYSTVRYREHAGTIFQRAFFACSLLVFWTIVVHTLEIREDECLSGARMIDWLSQLMSTNHD